MIINQDSTSDHWGFLKAEGIGNHEEEKEDVCKFEEEEEEKLRTRLAQLPFPGRRSKDLKVLKWAQQLLIVPKCTPSIKVSTATM